MSLPCPHSSLHKNDLPAEIFIVFRRKVNFYSSIFVGGGDVPDLCYPSESALLRVNPITGVINF